MEKESKQRFRLTKLERAWILYDVGNSAFVLMVATLIPIFFNALALQFGQPEPGCHRWSIWPTGATPARW